MNKLSIITPFLNEAENLPELYRRLKTTFESRDETYEMIFIDDGSTDNSVRVLGQLMDSDPRVRIVRFSRNFGHQAAVSAGLRYATGNAAVVLDADLQDPPEVISAMIDKWREGFDVVYGVRQKRKEGPLLKLAYFLFYRLMRKIASFQVPLDAGDFALMDRKIVDLINAMPEKGRFVRGLRGWVGYRQTGLPYERDNRQAGTSKYSFLKLCKLALDGLIAYSTVPLRIAVWVGVFFSLSGALYFIYILYRRIALNVTPQGWASLASIMLVLGGVQLLVLGIIGEYISRIYEEVKARPSYLVKEVLEKK